MRLLVTGAGIAAVLLISSCKSTRQVYEEQKLESSRKEETSIVGNVSRSLETEYLGDSLIGRMPLPYTVPRAAQYQIESGGITLDLTLSDSSLSYRAVAKPVARSTLIQEDSTSQTSKLNEDGLLVEKKSETKKKVGLPWWIWPILIVVLLLTVLGFLRKFKIPF